MASSNRNLLHWHDRSTSKIEWPFDFIQVITIIVHQINESNQGFRFTFLKKIKLQKI